MPRPNSVSSTADPSDPGAADRRAIAEAQLASLVGTYGRLIAQAIRRVAGTAGPSDLADIEQHVHLALWQQVRREQVIEHPASYVYKAAIREAVRAVKKLRTRAEDPLDAAPPQVAGPASRADRITDERHVQDAVAEALQAMAADRARAVRGHLMGFSVEELMDMYGWTYQRARNLISRGMAELRAELRRRGLP